MAARGAAAALRSAAATAKAGYYRSGVRLCCSRVTELAFAALAIRALNRYDITYSPLHPARRNETAESAYMFEHRSLTNRTGAIAPRHAGRPDSGHFDRGDADRNGSPGDVLGELRKRLVVIAAVTFHQIS